MNEFNNPLFVHIPKTGGTSITWFLRGIDKHKWKRDPFLKNHDTVLELKASNTIPDDTFIFTVVRNPFTRAFSYYKHFLRKTESNLGFRDFLSIVENYMVVDARTPFIRHIQSHYIVDENKNIAVDKIYKLENIEEFESDFNTKLQRLNTGSYNSEEYYKTYTDENIKWVQKLYHTDFVNFNYSFNFQ